MDMVAAKKEWLARLGVTAFGPGQAPALPASGPGVADAADAAADSVIDAFALGAEGAKSAASDAATAMAGKLPSPMLPDCKVVHGKVPGPENHLLCTTHNHVVDVTAKMIIAHSLPEYIKAHPQHHGGGHGGGHDRHGGAPAAHKPADGKGPAATPAAEQKSPASDPSQLPPIKIPEFTGSARDVFAQECALLDTFKPYKENPEIYAAMVGGQEASLPKAQAEALIAKISARLLADVDIIQSSNDYILQNYKETSAHGAEHIGAGLNKFVSLVTGNGWIHDPGDALTELKGDWDFSLHSAKRCVGQRQFEMAAKFIAGAEIKGAQAEHLFTAYVNKVLASSGSTLTVLKTVESSSKFVSKTIATVTFGPAGAAAIDTTFAAADVAGQALAGQKIDWAGKVIDLGMDVLLDKFGSQAEAAIKGRVAGLIESKFKGIAKEQAEKIAEKLAKKAVEKGSDIVRDQLKEAAKEHHGDEKMTYEELAKQTVASMQKPDAKMIETLQAAIEKDPDFQKARAHAG